MLAASDTTARLLRDNWARVCEQVHDACACAGRDAQQVQVVGVSKYVPPDLAGQLFDAGCTILGENRPQSLWDKVAYFQASGRDVPAACLRWHLIGHLQRNKLRRTLPMLSMLHSLDSLRLAEAVSSEAHSIGRRLPVLLEVNVTGDSSKTGLSAAELPAILAQVDQLTGIEIKGLMAMSSLAASAQEARHEFEQVRELRDQLQQEFHGHVTLDQLSMGMSGDYREAIAAGATLVRIGSSLWEGILEP